MSGARIKSSSLTCRGAGTRTFTRSRNSLPVSASPRISDVIRIPTELPVMALSNAVLFPHALLPLHIFERRYRTMLEHSLGGDRMFSVALMKPGISEAREIKDLFPIAGVD